MCAAKPAGIQSAATYTAAGAGSGATIVYAGATSASSTPSVTPTVGATPSTPATTSATAQVNVESGYGGPDYAGAYAHNFTASDVTATPTTGSTGSSTVTTSAAASTVVAFDTVLNPAVVYGNMTAVNTSSSRTIASGTGSFAEVSKLLLTLLQSYCDSHTITVILLQSYCYSHIAIVTLVESHAPRVSAYCWLCHITVYIPCHIAVTVTTCLTLALNNREVFLPFKSRV